MARWQNIIMKYYSPELGLSPLLILSNPVVAQKIMGINGVFDVALRPHNWLWTNRNSIRIKDYFVSNLHYSVWAFWLFKKTCKNLADNYYEGNYYKPRVQTRGGRGWLGVLLWSLDCYLNICMEIWGKLCCSGSHALPSYLYVSLFMLTNLEA